MREPREFFYEPSTSSLQWRQRRPKKFSSRSRILQKMKRSQRGQRLKFTQSPERTQRTNQEIIAQKSRSFERESAKVKPNTTGKLHRIAQERTRRLLILRSCASNLFLTGPSISQPRSHIGRGCGKANQTSAAKFRSWPSETATRKQIVLRFHLQALERRAFPQTVEKV